MSARPEELDVASTASLRGGTVLVIEDEAGISSLLRAYLLREGYRPLLAATGMEGLAALRASPVRIVLLDLGLPDVDGFELCRRIRSEFGVPIVVLTARDEEIDRVAGLEVGADDYVTKPFSPRELVARLKAVLRRAERQPGADVLQLGEVVLRRGEREVLVAEQPVELRPKEFELLAYLMENPNVVLSRDQILERVWGYFADTRTVDVHVAQLRRKLGQPGLIKTYRGSGYKAVRP